TAEVGGSVTFYDNEQKLGTRTVRGGTASMPAKGLDAGGHNFVAEYTVSRTTVTSDPTVVEITPASTGTVVRGSPLKVDFGTDLTLTARTLVMDPSNGQVSAGTITFYADGDLLATVPVGTTGRAVFDTTDLALGPHTITAEYDGDDQNYEPSP